MIGTVIVTSRAGQAPRARAQISPRQRKLAGQEAAAREAPRRDKGRVVSVMSSTKSHGPSVGPQLLLPRPIRTGRDRGQAEGGARRLTNMPMSGR